MSEFHFQLKANWNGGRLGKGEISSGNLQTAVSVPEDMGGPGTGTNPEEMLLGAASTCYMITLASVLENRKLPVTSLTLITDGLLSSEGGLHFVSITHKPSITLSLGVNEEQIEMSRKAAERAEQACMISKALRGNVTVHVEPQILVE
ncbi:MAG TPA: OsmC family protein [Bacillota bacterium]|nr:OsmC family protein [Bacillota bacterium]